MSNTIEKFGTHAVLAVAFTSLGAFLGGEFVAQGYENELALAHTQHTDNILTSLNYFRDGEMELGHRVLEISLESGRLHAESSANEVSDAEILTLTSDLFRNIDEYRNRYPVQN